MSQSIPFKVIAIKDSITRDGFIDVTVEDLLTSNTEEYTRRPVIIGHRKVVTIQGCRIHFKKEYDWSITYKVISIERAYVVAGKKRKSTIGFDKNKIDAAIDSISELTDEPEKEKPIDDFGFDEVENKIEQDVKEVVSEPEVPIVVDEPKPSYPKGKVKHEKYQQIMTCLECGIPVYLAGPAGSGKNHTVEQIAKEEGWNFYFSNSVQQEYKLTGFIDAGGDYHETEFYKACTDENESVFFLDEIDASIPEVLVLLNAAIANGYFEFPNGRVEFEHVHFVAAGNTVGSGADEQYTGRMVLDQATLDRFAIIQFDYDINIELKLTKGNRNLIDFVHELRDVSKSQGIRATFSYRCLSMVHKLEKTDMDIVTILQIAIFKGLDKDTINQYRLYGDTKYHDALKTLQM